MKIRLGSRGDVQEVAGFLKEMWLIHANNEPEYVSRKKIGAYPTRRIIKYLEDCFNGSKKSYLLVAEEEGEIAGVLKADVRKVESFFVETKVLYLDDAYVKDKYRGKGLAKALQEEVEKIAKRRKIKWLKARIYEFNKPAQGVAKSAGMKRLYSEYFKNLG